MFIFLSISSKFVENSQSTSENCYLSRENWLHVSYLKADIDEQLSDGDSTSPLPQKLHFNQIPSYEAATT